LPEIKPLSRFKLVKKLRLLGFEGPFGGGKHSFMKRDKQRIIIPNPHRGDIGVILIKKIIKQIDISERAWELL
jgi:predicted RNA binding protein YcfA (HicA-like mRNA interferase family)